MKTVLTVILLACLGNFHFLFAQSDAVRAKAELVLQKLITEDADHLALLPSQSAISQTLINGDQLTIRLSFPREFLDHTFDENIHEEMVEHFASGMAGFPFSQIHLEALNTSDQYQALSDFLQSPSWEPLALADNNDPFPYHSGDYTRKGIDLPNAAQPKGILKNKTVWLSAGHGWKYDFRRECFKTQRHNSHGLVEDFTTIEGVNYHLLKYLHQAGANVWTVRERDMNVEEVIVDNDQGAPHYHETGAWAKSKTNGYLGKSYRYAISAKKASAAAHFKPNIPSAGNYWVSVRYVSGTNRTVDARFKIIHAGGESMVSINQEIHGDTWVYLGQFYFEKGRSGKVVLVNQSSESGQAIIADAVRFGGGRGTVPDCDTGRKSGEPRFEEAARYYAKFQGFPYCLNDVMIRPKYAEWELAKGSPVERRNSIYLSWHTNASDRKSSGSESYMHSRRPVKGSRLLRDFIHKEVIQDIRQGWDKGWSDRGAKSADFGELRGLKTMPGVLLEIAFHDHSQDAHALSSPAFRDLVARSVYKGVVRYFAAKDRKAPVFLPEPPHHIVAFNKGKNEVQLTWKAPPTGGIYGHAARDYKIYYSTHPKAFANWVESKSTSFTFSKLKAGTTYYFRIAACNAGGESFRSPVLALRTPDKNKRQQKYLIVDGFDRLDKGLAIKVKESLPRYAPLGNTRRLFLERMNNYDYAGEHAKALEQTGVYFDGATNEAITKGLVDLKNYDGVDWYLGRESVHDFALNALEIKYLKRYLDNGGNLIISGSELAYTLDHKEQGKSFYRNYLKAAYQGDDAGQNDFAGYGIFKHLDGGFGPADHVGYAVYSPDYLRASAGGKPILKYNNGQVAAVAYKGHYGLVNFAFPLESIEDEQLRGALLQKAIAYFGNHEAQENLVLADLPDVFRNELRIDLERAPEGRAVFELFSPEGEAILAQTWSHSGSGEKVFSTHRLPPALYQYRFELMGLEQRGFLLKEE